jgi:threonine dehydratase
MFEVAAEVERAEARIRPYTRETYLQRSEYLSALGGADVRCKLENLQHTGSFKARGAMNKLLTLTPDERRRGVITASTGNHGAAVARSARQVGTSCTVVVPEHASKSKLTTVERLGATVRLHGDDCVESERYARQWATEHGVTYVSPYNDPLVVGGQGTVGLELARQLEHIDAVFVAVGSGGLISGTAGYLKSRHPEVRFIGCSPRNSAVMMESVKAGRVLDLPSLPTLSDGTAGGVEEDSITFDLARTLVDEWVTVTEEEIGDTLRRFVDAEHLLIEGAAAVAVASYEKLAERFRDQTIVLVICGGNISAETLRTLL